MAKNDLMTNVKGRGALGPRWVDPEIIATFDEQMNAMCGTLITFPVIQDATITNGVIQLKLNMTPESDMDWLNRMGQEEKVEW